MLETNYQQKLNSDKKIDKEEHIIVSILARQSSEGVSIAELGKIWFYLFLKDIRDWLLPYKSLEFKHFKKKIEKCKDFVSITSAIGMFIITYNTSCWAEHIVLQRICKAKQRDRILKDLILLDGIEFRDKNWHRRSKLTRLDWILNPDDILQLGSEETVYNFIEVVKNYINRMGI